MVLTRSPIVSVGDDSKPMRIPDGRSGLNVTRVIWASMSRCSHGIRLSPRRLQNLAGPHKALAIEGHSAHITRVTRRHGRQRRVSSVPKVRVERAARSRDAGKYDGETECGVADDLHGSLLIHPN